MAAVSTLLASTVTAPASGGLLGDVLGDVLGELEGTVEDLLDPVLGDGSPLDLLLDLDTSVEDVVAGLVDPLTEPVAGVLDPITVPPAPTADSGEFPSSPLVDLEVLDGVIEDVAVPTVIAPVADAVAPVVGSLEPSLQPLGDVVGPAGDATYAALADLVALGLEEAAYQAVVTTPTGSITRDGVVDVPTAIDVTGDGVQDLTLEVRVLTARPSLRVTRLPGAPTDLPVRVEAVIAPGGASDPARIAVGFDALGTTLPDTVRATVVEGLAGGDDLTVELHAVGAGPTLAVVASQFTASPAGPVDPSEISVAFTPVPSDVTATATGIDGGDTVAVDLATSQPTVVDAAFRTVRGATTTELGATVDRVPGHLAIGVAQAGASVTVDCEASGPVDALTLRQSVSEPGRDRSAAITLEGIQADRASLSLDPDDLLGFVSSAPIAAVTVELTDTAGIVDRATTLRARLAGLPEELSMALGEDTLGLDALGGTLGSLEVLLTSGPDLLPGPDTDGIVLRDTAAEFVVGARLTNLRSLLASLGADRVDATLATAGGRPFVVDAATDTTAVVAQVASLPPTVAVGLAGDTVTWSADAVASLSAEITDGTRTTALAVGALPRNVAITLAEDGSMSWSADAVTPLVEVEVVDAAGVVDRATSLQVRIEDLPQVVTLATTAGGASIVADAPIGLVELLATNGPDLSLPAGAQGVVVRDEPSTYVIAARLSGLQEATFAADPATLTVVTDGPRPVTLDLHEASADGSSTTILVELADLPAVASISLAETAGGVALTYDASAPIAAVTASLDEVRADGSQRTLALDVADLPTTIALTASGDTFGYTASSGITAMDVDLSDTAGVVDRATRLALRATGLPAELEVDLAGDAPALDVPVGVIGEIELLLTDGPELSVADGVDGVLLRDDDDQFVVAARITGLRGIALAPDGSGITLRTLGGRTFTLDARLASGDDATSILGTLVGLPAEVSLALTDPSEAFALDYTASSVLDRLTAELVVSSVGVADVTTRVDADDLPTSLSLTVAEEGAVTYAASDRLPQLDVELVDPSGVFDTATRAVLHVEGLPTGLTVELTEGGAAVDTTGGAIDLLEILLTSGPDTGLAPGVQGLLLRDTDTELVVAARVAGLTGLGFATTADGAELSLDTAGGVPFVVDTLVADADAGTSTAIGATLDLLPSSVSLALTESAAGDRTVTYAADAAMARLAATLALTDPDGTSTFGLEAEGVPTDLSLDLGTDGQIAYAAAGGLDRLAITGSDPDGIFATATDLQAELLDLPAAASITIGEDGSLVLDALGGMLGSLEALATSSAAVEVGLVPGVDGIALLDEPGAFGAYVRVHDLEVVELATAPIALTLDTVGGATFVVDASLAAGGSLGSGLDDVDVLATVEPLPDRVTIGLAEAGGQQVLTLDSTASIDAVALSLTQGDPTGAPLSADVLIQDTAPSMTLGIDPTGGVTYTASTVVPLLSVDAHDADGLFDRADTLRLRLEGLPAALDLALSDTGAIGIDAHGGTLGLLEAQATTGPDERLPASNDGVLYKDLTDRLVVFARFTGLRSADVTQSPLPNVDLSTSGGRPLQIGLYESVPGKASPIPGQEFTTALLSPSPANVDLALLPGQPGQLNISYAASSTANSLAFETNGGDRWLTSASISNPVPTSFVACQAGDRSCAGQSGTGSVGSLRFDASQHTTLDVFDCVRPLNANCRRGGSPSQYIDVDSLRVRYFRFTGDARNTPIDGDLLFDTNNHTMQGRVVYREGPDRRYTLNFGSGFKAQDRVGRFNNYPLPGWLGGSINVSGTITCGPFSFDVFVRVLGIGITLDAKRLVGC